MMIMMIMTIMVMMMTMVMMVDDDDDHDHGDDNKMVISQNKGLILEMGGFSFQLNFMLFL